MSKDEINSSTRLGFIGLGYLGSRIARRLIAAGFPVTVFDRNQAKAAQFSAVGAKVAADLAKLAGDVEVVLSCLRDDAAVEDVYFGTTKVLAAASPITTIIELSTVTPATARRLHAAGAKLGISVLDVAISGSKVAAESGTLTLFGGGDAQVFEMAQPIFRAIRGTVVPHGPRQFRRGHEAGGEHPSGARDASHRRSDRPR